MRIAISFPPFESPKGLPLLTQNRQYQVFSTRDSSGGKLAGLLNRFVGDNATVIFPLLPAYAATLLSQHGHDVVWLDGIAEGWDWEEYCRQIQKADPQLMMIETKTPSARPIYSAIADLKARFPNMVVVLVGDHITALPEEPFLYCPVDFTVRGGQFDFSLLNIANHLEGKEELASGVFWNDDDGTRNSGTQPNPPQYTNTPPHIDRELVRWRLYSHRNGNFLKTPGTYAWAVGSSGGDCWWRRPVAGGPKDGGGCTFCSWTSLLPQFSVRPVNDYLDELEALAAMGIREVFDDTGTFPTGRWLKDFMKGFQERGLDKVLMMGCNMRADALSQREYEMLAACNFRFILYGIESGNQRTLDLLNKGTTVQQQRDSLRWASEAGLEPHATIMMGYPWETFDDARTTVENAKEWFGRGWINTLQGTVVMPYPGTQLYAQARENRWLRFDGPDNWHRWDMREPVLTSLADPDQIMGLVQSLYTSFLTPRYMLRKMKDVTRSRDHFKYYVVRGSKYVVGHLLDFRRSQLSEPDSVGALTGVAELPVHLYTVGGATAPVPLDVQAARFVTDHQLPVI
jgi:anaerobic magnesium-protoporphyrin IX monomethyl ester cyclase